MTMAISQLSTNVLNDTGRDTISNAKLLVVGAGGIGCELLKNLVLTGFCDLEVIDLDTIDVSNLNRQFLFQKQHVGKSKAKVARESILKLKPAANVVARHDSIFNPDYNVNYFKQFNLVLNALDNRAARNHVNRMCLAANIPLIESGSAGYLGQVTVIKKGETECYECTPAPRQKSFPGCTIRNTPSELIHCVVWAKYLFNQLFGEEDADQDVSPDAADPAATGSKIADRSDTSKNTPIIQRVSTRQWAKDCDYNCPKIFNKLFFHDIQYLLSMDKLWKKRKAPTPVMWEENSVDQDASTTMTHQKMLSLNENMLVFARSISQLKEQVKEADDGTLVWDKDNVAAMNFTSCVANIRAFIFSIEQKSVFEIKSMAGNIIPAIATTNAIVAGLLLLQAMCVIRDQFEKCKSVFVCKVANHAKKLLIPCSLDPPKPSCYVCVEKPEIVIKVNTNMLTLLDLQEKILKLHLGMLAPDVEILDGQGTILISSEEGDMAEADMNKLICEFGLKNGSRLRADDFLQNYDIIINIVHSDNFEDDALFEVVSSNEINSQKESESSKAKPFEDSLEVGKSKDSLKKRKFTPEHPETNNHMGNGHDSKRVKISHVGSGDADSFVVEHEH